MLAHAPNDLKRPAMACLFNASANDPLAAEAMLEAGMLSPCLALLERAKEDEPPGNLTPNPKPEASPWPCRCPCPCPTPAPSPYLLPLPLPLPLPLARSLPIVPRACTRRQTERPQPPVR